MSRMYMRTTGFLSSMALFLGLAATMPVLSAHAAPTEKDMQTQHVVEKVNAVTIDWSEGIVRVIGTGTSPERGSLTQKRLMAERSATADAYLQLANAIYGINVNSESIVRDYVSESETIKTYINALIKGAQKTDQRFLDDGSIEIEMAVKLYSSGGLSGVLQPQKHVTPPPPVTLEADPKPGDYSGVIVDCRNLGLKPAMSPAIVSQSGGEVYLGNLEIKPDYVINEGIVGYVHSLDQARQNKRVGDNPLIIKGTSATGNFRTDVVISEPDTKQLLGLEKLHQLLKDAKVIFVM